MQIQYGEEEGAKRWKAYCDRQAYTNSQEYKGMTDEEFKEYNKSRAVTLENQIRKYGVEEGTKRFNSYCRRQGYTCTLDYFIKTYGREDGLKRYENAYHSRKNYSEIASKLFAKLDKKLKYKLNCMYMPKTQEFVLQGNVNSPHTFLYDFTIPELKLIIEYNGDLFHGNPKFFQAEDHPNFYRPKVTAQELWDLDKEKKERAEAEGYKVITVWDSDYTKDPKKVESELCYAIAQRLIEKYKS